ncbi:UNVERIFIED_ORG: leucine rich repeat (LRR) protein [Zoogloea ramigera]|uniref:STM4015 family protein n=1 Tax=Duganella zoogloeoides TaxID=75659 RepID=A0ABZ0Y3J4_9BURK|nr:STM4015 family protein [Duganella zoogloeoides]WQH06613.1 STM4015 family protein [Duganella zoogloeoides]
MTISDSTTTFRNKTVVQYDPDSAFDPSPDVVYRLALDYDDTRKMPELIDSFLARADKATLEALVIGMWGEPYEAGADAVIAALVSHAPQLPALRALFIGDMTYEECEISWIVQGNYKPLLDAFPQLEELRIRGGNELTIEPFAHQNLRKFTIESGGLDQKIAQALAASSMPNLEHLELWLGADDYGFSGDVALYQQVLAQLATPTLRYLGLRDSEIADDLAAWLANEPLLATVTTLDLSLGTIGDAGAEALLNGTQLGNLKRLDLSHHYISPANQDKLRALPFDVVLADPQEEDQYDGEGHRYVAVGE